MNDAPPPIQPPLQPPLQPPILTPPNQDEEHLRMLALGFRIHGGLVAAFGFCYMLFMGSMMSSIAQAPQKAGEPPFPTAFFGLFFMAFIGLALAYGASRSSRRPESTSVGAIPSSS